MEAVGLDGRKMSDIAAALHITVGSLTTSMNGLVKKGYTERERSGKDRRVVYIRLTAKGKKAYAHHAEFHRRMTEPGDAAAGFGGTFHFGKGTDRPCGFF